MASQHSNLHEENQNLLISTAWHGMGMARYACFSINRLSPKQHQDRTHAVFDLNKREGAREGMFRSLMRKEGIHRHQPTLLSLLDKIIHAVSIETRKAAKCVRAFGGVL